MQQAGDASPEFADPAALGELLLSTQTPAHREEAAKIFKRLLAGADVTDIEPLTAAFDGMAPKPRPKSHSDDMRTHRFPKIGGDRHNR